MTDNSPHPHVTFIRLLGGAPAVTKWLNEKASHDIGVRAIYKWTEIPLKYRADLARMAVEKGCPIPDEFFPKMAAQ